MKTPPGYDEVYDTLEDTVDRLEHVIGLAEYWKAQAGAVESDAHRLLDALMAIHEKNAALAVLAAGFHPFHAPGIELTETLRRDLREGTLEPADITTDLVWQVAGVRGLQPDLVPIL